MLHSQSMMLADAEASQLVCTAMAMATDLNPGKFQRQR